MSWRFELTPVDSVPDGELSSRWLELEKDSDCSFFQSWLWVGAWLEALGKHKSALLLLSLSYEGESIALGIFGSAAVKLKLPLYSKRLCLLETGNIEFDKLTIEHNGLLIRRGCEDDAWSQVMREMDSRYPLWDELRFSGLSDQKTLNLLVSSAKQSQYLLRREAEKPFYWVNLDIVRDANSGYLGLLSKNTRYQIRRATKEYEKYGELEITEATSPAAASEYISELKKLHQAYWQKKAEPGAFSSKFACEFHDHIVRRGISNGRVQILRFSAGETAIGYLYNFVYRDRVLNYQSGFLYGDNPKEKPGLVCHSLAITHNATKGHKIYDFLMGNMRYKQSLATDRGEMYWITVQRPLLKFRLENALRGMKSLVSSLRKQAG